MIPFAFSLIFHGIIEFRRRKMIAGWNWMEILRGISATIFVFTLALPFPKRSIVRWVLTFVFLGFLSNCLVSAINGGMPLDRLNH